SVGRGGGQVLTLLAHWLREAHGSLGKLRFVRDARELVVAAGRVKGGAEGEERAVQVGWKLYELTAFILILESLEEMGYSMGGKFGEDLVFSRGSGSDERAVRIRHDSPLDSSRMARAYPGSVDLEALRGKPDISIMVESSSGDRRTAVLDCKFSYRQGYLTSGRFNVMAYMYKYGANYGVLVFPGILSDESREESGLYEAATGERIRQHGDRGCGGAEEERRPRAGPGPRGRAAEGARSRPHGGNLSPLTSIGPPRTIMPMVGSRPAQCG
ncbi:MAG: hypothetical protein RAK18_06510, partial [Conexivisphaerales archaeon]|nr:hypothetical protein [Conexivisphaerales archaeon]